MKKHRIFRNTINIHLIITSLQIEIISDPESCVAVLYMIRLFSMGVLKYSIHGQKSHLLSVVIITSNKLCYCWGI